MIDTSTWRARAACRGADTNLFFPERGESTAAAKAVCAGCPVASECLDYALDTLEHHGIWGGLSERERRKVRRQRAAARRVSRTAGTVTVTAADIATEAARRDTVHRLYRSGMTAIAVAAATGMSESTVWRLLRSAA